MLIKILMITCNRPDYTQLSLTRLCDTAPKNLKITIWDNDSTSETKDIISKFKGRECIEKVIFHNKNAKLREPTNWFWRNCMESEVGLIGKVDDDCLVPDNWCAVLQKCHEDIPKAGIIGCWRFLPEDFNHSKAVKKIFSYNKHKIFRNCWIEGSGYLMKRRLLNELGYLRPDESFSHYCIRAAAKGYINGWYYPFMYQEHMDDPRTPHSNLSGDKEFLEQRPLSANTFGIQSRSQWIEWIKSDAQKIQESSINPYDHIGLRAKIKRNILKVLGKKYHPKIKQ